jgi:hypothetical protein
VHWETTRYVAARLRERGLHAQPMTAGHRIAVEVRLPDGRVARWRGSQVTGYEALVYSNGVLIGAVPPPRGSTTWTPDDLVDAIADAGYGGREQGHSSHAEPAGAGSVRLMVNQKGRPRTGHLTRI